MGPKEAEEPAEELVRLRKEVRRERHERLILREIVRLMHARIVSLQGNDRVATGPLKVYEEHIRAALDG